MLQFSYQPVNRRWLISILHMSENCHQQRMDAHNSNHDHIHSMISDAIIKHRLRPGTRLREDALVDVFGISRTGIRKILQRLALEHLVTLTPRRGARVSRPTAREARDVFATRQLIESDLIPLVAGRVSATDVEFLYYLAAEEHRAIDADAPSLAIKRSAEFHKQLAVLSGNAVIAEIVSRLCSRTSLILAVYGKTTSQGCKTHDHTRLVDYLEKNRVEQAVTLMRKHLEDIEASLVIDAGEDENSPDLHQIFSTQ